MRLFVAVWPPAHVVEAVRSALAPSGAWPDHADSHGRRPASPRPDAGLRWTPPEQWHVTLRFLGDADLAQATDAFRSVVVPGPAGTVVGPATGRFGRRVLHVPVTGLEGLAAATVVATGAVGRVADDRLFAGHLTLARARAQGGTDLSGWCGVPVAARWTVGELSLVVSRSGREGARYEVVDRLALT